MPLRRLRFSWTFTESERASGDCRTLAWSAVAATVDGMNVCITGSHADDTHGSGGGRQSSSRPCWTHRHTQDTQTQQSTVTTTTMATTTTKSRGGQQRPSSSSSLSWLRKERNKKGEKFRQNRGTLLDLLVGLILHSRSDNTNDSTGGERNQWLAKKRARPVESSKECTEELPARTHTQARAD